MTPVKIRSMCLLTNKDKIRKILKSIIINKYLLIMIMPCIIFKLIFNYIPIYGLVLAFRKFDYSSPLIGVQWANNYGFQYFIQFFSMPDAWKIIRNTLLINVYGLIFGFPAPVILALLLNEAKNGFLRKFTSTVSYIPNFISTVVLVGMLKLILSPGYGIINKIIVSLGGAQINFMASPEWFRTIFVSSGIWQTVGWGSVVYMASISGIDSEQYEAAFIDGASRLKRMLYITLPGIKNVIMILLIFYMGGMLSVSTEKVLLMYSPLVYETSDVIGTFLYRVGLLNANFSLGVALGLLESVAGLVLIIITNRMAKKYSDVGIW
jgi:putative aldouronate transport system permease protein